MQRVALGGEQQAIKLAFPVAFELQIDGAVLPEARQVDVFGVLEDLRRLLTVRMGQNPVAMVEVSVDFHETNGDEAVEPRVGHCLHGLLEPIPFDACLKLFALVSNRARIVAPSDNRHVTADDSRLDFRGGQPIKCRAVFHRLDEIAASFRSVCLELVAVHAGHYRI